MNEYKVRWLSIYGTVREIIVMAENPAQARKRADEHLLDEYESYRRILSVVDAND